jgi:Clostripain family
MAPKNKWTLLFFLAGDNNLSPLMISELKALKDAGFQRDTTVLAHFDPNPLGAPTRIYNVNRRRKDLDAASDYPRRSMIGDGTDTFIRHLKEDKFDPNEVVVTAGAASTAIATALKSPSEVSVDRALELFLGFARESHPADHYMLFLIGHGMIVANDAFLPDENPVSAISLNRLEEILRPFSKDVRKDGGDFELLALHSCSMSSIEVAYQLKDTAKYMMGTQGISFIGSWPYRQLLKEAFNEIERARGEVDIRNLVNDLYSRCLHNGTDFMGAGYSIDLSLCKLQAKEVNMLDKPIQQLVALLKRGLGDERVKQLILLAHWKSQSYWEENFTDLFDFCQCLSRSCDKSFELQKLISEACENVMSGIRQLVERSESFGPTYQYSHGLSVYFPWSRPVENLPDENSNENPGILTRYQGYKFTTDLAGDSWFTFLDRYFKATLRDSRKVEDDQSFKEETSSERGHELFEAARESFNPFGPLARIRPNGSPEAGRSNASLEGGKPLPSVGLSCTCPSIKNYPQEVEYDKDEGKARLSKESFSITRGALEAFK